MVTDEKWKNYFQDVVTAYKQYIDPATTAEMDKYNYEVMNDFNIKIHYPQKGFWKSVLNGHDTKIISFYEVAREIADRIVKESNISDKDKKLIAQATTRAFNTGNKIELVKILFVVYLQLPVQRGKDGGDKNKEGKKKDKDNDSYFGYYSDNSDKKDKKNKGDDQNYLGGKLPPEKKQFGDFSQSCPTFCENLQYTMPDDGIVILSGKHYRNQY